MPGSWKPWSYHMFGGSSDYATELLVPTGRASTLIRSLDV
jgi:hypothetical protein